MRRTRNRQHARPGTGAGAEPTISLTRATTADEPRLPHEIDESPGTPVAPDPKMRQAERDLATGQQDTDRRSEALKLFRRGPTGHR
jgi:hypothetical protein